MNNSLNRFLPLSVGKRNNYDEIRNVEERREKIERLSVLLKKEILKRTCGLKGNLSG
jgi:hypothetical protein